MNHTLSLAFELAFAGVAGGLLGAIFFGGLWWTLRRAFASKRPAVWVGVSLLLRMACVVGGFILVSSGDWRRLLACLLGFWAARWAVLRVTSRFGAQSSAVPRLSAEKGSGETTTRST